MVLIKRAILLYFVVVEWEICRNLSVKAERVDKLLDFFEVLKKITSSFLMFPQSKGAEQCARGFSDKGLYYFDADDGTRPGICTFHKYYTKQSCPKFPLKYEQLPEQIREILKHNFMEVEDFSLIQTIYVDHAYK